MSVALFLALSQAAPIPPPVTQVTADCVRPIYATDMLVCGDPALSALDSRMKAALAASPGLASDATMIEGQADWFRRSRRCAFQVDHRACALQAYDERLKVLKLAASHLPPSGQCRLSDGTVAEIALAEASAVLSRDGRLLAVGVPATPAWQPFIRYVSGSDEAEMRRLDGKFLARCRMSDGKGPR